MTVLIDDTTAIMVQGAAGNAGVYHIGEMLAIGTRVVAGADAGKGGADVHGVPVHDSVAAACDALGSRPDATLIFQPAHRAAASTDEALDAAIPLVVLVAEGVPVHDTLRLVHRARDLGVRLVGPNTPGLLSPGRAKAGLMPMRAFSEGSVGMVSRSGTLSYETAMELTARSIGQSTFVGVGGDLARGTSMAEAVALLNDDPATQIIVIIGEIGGNQEETATTLIAEQGKKPVVAMIAGRAARPGRRMGHAGALVTGGVGAFAEKVAALQDAGIEVADSPADAARRVAALLEEIDG